MTDPNNHRDPRRRFSEAQRRDLFARQGGKCVHCSDPLPSDFDSHHVVPWALGGPTELHNGVAVCAECHREQPLHYPAEITPREWQSEALAKVLPALVGGQFATVAAAPGAGKTLFTALTIREMLSRGAIDRVSVFVPNGNLRTQWATELGKVGIPLQPDPRYLIEDQGYVGNVLTYAKLNADNVARLAQVEPGRTLYVLDEVHHLGRDDEGGHKAWSLGVGSLVGTVASPENPVLNLTGTPFRSVRGERISTCRYREVDRQHIELVTNYAITSSKLIEDGHLRHLQVHSWDAGLNVVNIRTGEMTDNRVVDLDSVASSVRTAALRKLTSDVEGFVAPVLSSLVTVLSTQQAALHGHHVKGLVICDTVKQAELVYQTAQERLSLPRRALMKAVSDEGADAKRAIEDFRTSTEPAILVAVRMVSEGFDAPDVSAIAYMSSWTAPLFIAQMVARAMRVTPVERSLGRIPAEVIIPGDPAMLDAFTAVLRDVMHMLDFDPSGPQCPVCSKPAGACYCLTPIVDKMCRTCEIPRKICSCPKGPMAPPVPPAGVEVEITESAAAAGLHRDGEEIDLALMEQIARHVAGQLDAIHVPGATLAVQKAIQVNPYLVSEYLQKGDDQ